ncbi:MAG TPA: archease [Acidimicrobiia bacterium]|nr:archease [Acidimicrobiia bacterium]
MAHRVLAHTADTGIEATADSLASLIRELLLGMFGLEATIEPSAAQRWITLRVEAPTPEDLVVDTLSELLFHSEIEDLVFCDFRVEMDRDELAVSVEAGGVPVGAVEPEGPPIKAVTFHDLVAEERDGGWYARVYFDV